MKHEYSTYMLIVLLSLIFVVAIISAIVRNYNFIDVIYRQGRGNLKNGIK